MGEHEARHRGRFADARVDSDIVLSLPPCDGTERSVVVVTTHRTALVISSDEMAVAITDGTMHGERWRFGRLLGSDDWTFEFSTLCRATISRSGDEILVSTNPAVPNEWIADIVGWLLVYRQVICGGWAFHASAVADPTGRAIAFVGPSGSGKSTLAGVAITRGYTLLADDSLVGEVETGHVAVLGTTSGVRLRSGARTLVDSMRGATVVRTYDDRTAAAVRTCARAELGAVVVLGRRTTADTGIRDLSPPELTAALLRNSKVGLWTNADMRDAEFDAAAGIAQLVRSIEVCSPEMRAPAHYEELFDLIAARVG